MSIEGTRPYDAFFSALRKVEMSDDSEDEIIQQEFAKLRKSSEKEFAALEKTHSNLFNCPEIKEAVPKKKHEMAEVVSDEIAVEYIDDCKGLCAYGTGTGLVVMARANSNNGPCIALCYAVTLEPEEVLNGIIEELTNKGCEKKTIKIYIVGGQLPYQDVNRIPNSIDAEVKYLQLADKYPIVGVELNKAEGKDDSLDVFITKDEIIWRHPDQFECSSEEEGPPLKKRRLNPDENLRNGKVRNFV